MTVKFSLARFLDYLVYLVVILFDSLLAVIPERWSYSTGRFIGRLAYVLVLDRRAAAMENLTMAFGKDKSPQWIQRTALKSFEHMGMMGIEFFLLRRWSEKDMVERVSLSGRENFNLVMRPGNHGVVFLYAHFGCFEVCAAAIKSIAFRLNLIVTGLKNPFVSRYLFSRGGEDSGITVYPHKGIVKEMIGLLLQGKSVGFLGDQRGDVERGVIVDYFGSPAPANGVFAKIAIEGKARVIPMATYRVAEGRFRTELGKEIPIILTGDEQKDLIAVSQAFHNQFESWLRMYPEQGFWFQRKWRRAPSRHRRKKAAAKNSATNHNDLARGRG
jgi:Kdo2-lipid IVA lauroyltransferase/acyltransferase